MMINAAITIVRQTMAFDPPILVMRHDDEGNEVPCGPQPQDRPIPDSLHEENHKGPEPPYGVTVISAELCSGNNGRMLTVKTIAAKTAMVVLG